MPWFSQSTPGPGNPLRQFLGTKLPWQKSCQEISAMLCFIKKIYNFCDWVQQHVFFILFIFDQSDKYRTYLTGNHVML
jgi:hypothetical protein